MLFVNATSHRQIVKAMRSPLERLHPTVAEITLPFYAVRCNLVEEPVIFKEMDQKDACEILVSGLGCAELVELVGVFHGMDTIAFSESGKGVQRNARHGRIAGQNSVELVHCAAVWDGFLRPLNIARDLDGIG